MEKKKTTSRTTNKGQLFPPAPVKLLWTTTPSRMQTHFTPARIQNLSQMNVIKLISSISISIKWRPEGAWEWQIIMIHWCNGLKTLQTPPKSTRKETDWAIKVKVWLLQAQILKLTRLIATLQIQTCCFLRVRERVRQSLVDSQQQLCHRTSGRQASWAHKWRTTCSKSCGNGLPS